MARADMISITVEIVDTRDTFEITVTLWFEVEVILNRRLNTQVLCSVRRDVEVHFQNFFFRILLCQANSQSSFGKLTTECLSGIIGHIFNELLSDGTPSTLDGAGLGILEGRTSDTDR